MVKMREVADGDVITNKDGIKIMTESGIKK
jgi:hypothetical protein